MEIKWKWQYKEVERMNIQENGCELTTILAGSKVSFSFLSLSLSSISSVVLFVYIILMYCLNYDMQLYL